MSLYETAIRQQLHGLLDSSSHDFYHLDRVLAYALALQKTYGGDTEVLTAAALLHDLGRNDKTLHGEASIQASLRDAKAILATVEFPDEKIQQVLQAIAEHDQPHLEKFSSLESQILKEADFLAGGGATGILRSAMWTGESGQPFDSLIERLTRKMPARIHSLDLPHSRQLAQRDFIFTRLFLAVLQSEQAIPPVSSVPYIVIEGMSGSGKTTQITRLKTRYEAAGQHPYELPEPTAWFTQMKNQLALSREDKAGRLLLLLLDRHLNVKPRVEEHLVQGNPIISSRNYLSSMVYQSGEGWLSSENIAYLHQFLPQPTHLFLLDLPAEVAFERIVQRSQATNTPASEYETLEYLQGYREKYHALKQIFPYLHILDAQQPPETLHESIWQVLNPR